MAAALAERKRKEPSPAGSAYLDVLRTLAREIGLVAVAAQDGCLCHVVGRAHIPCASSLPFPGLVTDVPSKVPLFMFHCLSLPNNGQCKGLWVLPYHVRCWLCIDCIFQDARLVCECKHCRRLSRTKNPFRKYVMELPFAFMSRNTEQDIATTFQIDERKLVEVGLRYYL